MKKIIPVISVLLAIIIVAVIAVVLATRKDDTPTDATPDHIHEFGEWITTKEPTINTEGASHRSCTCGQTEVQPIAKLVPSEGLTFNSNYDGTCRFYGVGTCTDSVIIIPEVSPNGEKVVSVGYHSFQNAPNVTEVIVPNSITVIDSYSFAGSAAIKKITLGANTTLIDDGAFSDCFTLESIVIPNSVERIGDFAFFNCTALESITLPNSLVDLGNSAFFGCDNLSLNTYDNARYLGSRDNPYLILIEPINNNISSCTINPNTKFIYTNAFSLCSYLTEIIIPEGLISIEERAFSSCDSLESINIPASVIEICPYAFMSSHSLKAINVHADNTVYRSIDGTVYTKDGTVLVCYAMANPTTSLIIPDGVMEIAEGAFYGAKNLESVIIPDSVHTIGYSSFTLCDKLTSITIPNGVTKIDALAFNNCGALSCVFISKSVTEINAYAFSNCDSLTDVYFEGTEAEWLAINIDSNNTKLMNVTIHYNCTPSN